METPATAVPRRPAGFQARATVAVLGSTIVTVVFVLAVLFSLLQILVQVLYEPCPDDDPDCGAGRPPYLLYGLVAALAAGVALMGVQYWWRRWQRHHQFRPPPGWPPPPRRNWAPSAGWKPDPSWPPAPSGWRFWGEP